MVGMIVRVCSVASVVCMTASHTAHAQGRTQDYPTKPIRFVVPSTPGGGADVLARSIGAHRRGTRQAGGDLKIAQARAGSSAMKSLPSRCQMATPYSSSLVAIR